MRSILFTNVPLLILLALAGCNTNATPPPIVIGHVSDKTRLDKAGTQAELGIRLALFELSKDGALAETFAGRKIEVRHTDTKGEPDAFEAEAVRLDAINRSVALFGGLSAKEVAALDHVKMPVLTFHGQPVSGASKNVFYLGMSATRQGEVLARHSQHASTPAVVMVLDERRPDRAAFSESYQGSLSVVRRSLQATNIITVRFGKDPKWNELMERIRTHQASYVVFAGDVQDFNSFYKPFRAAVSHTTELVYAGSDGDHRLFDFGVEAKDPIVLATAFHADPTSEKVQTFLKAFREMPDKTEADVHAALAYDGMRLFVTALKETRTQVTPEKIREELLKIKDFDGVTGPLTITAERQVSRPIHVMSWTNGAVKLLKTYSP